MILSKLAGVAGQQEKFLAQSLLSRRLIFTWVARQPTLNLSTRKQLPTRNGKQLTLMQFRTFKSPPNSFNRHKEQFGAVALERMAIGIPVMIFAFIFLDVGAIVRTFVPTVVRERFVDLWRSMVRICRKIYHFEMKRAESLAANPANGMVDVEVVSEQDKVQERGVVDSVLEQFKTDRNDTKYSSTFREKRIIEYENRIRLYSNPDKIFRYFASVKIVYKNGDAEIYMTPDDFLRALTPGIKQPDGLGLDQFKKIDLAKYKDFQEENLFDLLQTLLRSHNKNDFKFNLQPDSIFYKLSKFGLINFSDFLFLLTLLSVSRRHFQIAFRMFDLNGDGEVEYHEFEKVQNAILSQTSIGQKMGKSVHYKGISSAVSRYFFGENLKNRLTTEKFVEFQQTLQNELLTLEFDRKKSDSTANDISEIDFADLLVAYANLSEKKRNRMIRRVKKKFSDGASRGISKDDYLEFFRFLRNINDVDVALTVYNLAGASIDQVTLKHVAQTVANVQLSDHIVDVVFTLFDDNDDGQLSNKEFVSVMKERLRRGLSKPKDTGLFKILHVMWKSLLNFEF